MESLQVLFIVVLSCLMMQANSYKKPISPMPEIYNPGRRCPEGWIFYDEICYLFHYEATIMTWREGQEECEKLGGFLAEIKTEAQQQYLMSVAFLEEDILGTKSWFIGLSDQGHEGRWVWQHSLKDTNFTFWDDDQPDDTDENNDCVIMDAEKDYEWVSVHCDTSGFDIGTPLCMRDDLNRLELRAGSEGGDGISSGTVYATNRDGLFGPVVHVYCEHTEETWRVPDVICRQLGFKSGRSYAWSHYGDVEEDFYVIRFYNSQPCTGNEEYIQQCEYTTDCAGYGTDGINACGVECFN